VTSGHTQVVGQNMDSWVVHTSRLSAQCSIWELGLRDEDSILQAAGRIREASKAMLGLALLYAPYPPGASAPKAGERPVCIPLLAQQARRRCFREGAVKAQPARGRALRRGPVEGVRYSAGPREEGSGDCGRGRQEVGHLYGRVGRPPRRLPRLQAYGMLQYGSKKSHDFNRGMKCDRSTFGPLPKRRIYAHSHH